MGADPGKERGLDRRPSDRAWAVRLCAAVYLLALTFVVMLQSPLRPGNSGLSGTDSSVFQTVVMMMRRGAMPYRDSFDHKGPLLYLIDYAGALISPRWGIWAVELISLFVTLWAMYRVARLCVGPVGACLAAAAAATPLLNISHNFFSGGNLVEEYAMPFIAVSAYIFLDYLDSGRVTRLRLAACGFCMGCVFLLRANMIAVWVVFCLAIAVRCLVRKDFAQLGTFILFFLAGFAAIVVPILIWLAAAGALIPFFDAYVLFNMTYAARDDSASASLVSAFRFFAEKKIVFLPLACSLAAAALAKAEKRFLYWTYTACLLLSLLMTAMSRYTFSHYGMALVPLLAFPLAAACRWGLGLAANLPHKLAPRAAGAGVAVLLAAVTVFSYGRAARKNWNAVISLNDRGLVSSVCAVIEEYAGPEDSISAFGNWDIIYLESGRPHAATYSYQSPIGSIDPEIMDGYFAQLRQELPKVVVLAQSTSSKMVGPHNTMDQFLREYGYAQVWAQGESYRDGAVVYARAAG